MQIRNILLTFLLKSDTIKANEEDRGRSAHGWSSQKRVGFALPNRLQKLKTEEPYKRKCKAPDYGQEHFFHILKKVKKSSINSV